MGQSQTMCVSVMVLGGRWPGATGVCDTGDGDG